MKARTYVPPQPDEGVSDNPYCDDADANQPGSRAMRWHNAVVGMTDCGHSKYDPCHNCEPIPAFVVTVKDGNWTGTFEEWQARGGNESARVSQLRKRVAALEAMRPHWAKGYSDDSVAAQCSSAALSQLWTLLGVDNQTAAVDRLKHLSGVAAPVAWQVFHPLNGWSECNPQDVEGYRFQGVAVRALFTGPYGGAPR